jgi:hypothetical protein
MLRASRCCQKCRGCSSAKELDPVDSYKVGHDKRQLLCQNHGDARKQCSELLIPLT